MMQVAGKPVRVLVVEDDPAQHAMLVSWLKAEGYQVTSFHDGLEARNHLAEQWADLLLLDWDVPGVTGEQLLSFVRGRSRSSVPVIFQTVHSSEADIAKILDTGADDFLVKPIDRSVLLARMRAVLRRASASNVDGRKMIVGECVLDRGKQALVANGATHALGTKEFDILWHLATHAGTVVQRQDLLSVVWGWDANVQTRSVDMYVSRVRTNLKTAGVGWTIQSVYATGYRLNLGSPTDDASSADSPSAMPAGESPSAPTWSPSAEPTLESVWARKSS
ncbi:response regulator transcription factor [Trinickia fusca]|uniref:DNA-binding response regulator n=1 Tax=Trinickia fusca TaxID=2419777 RepID=A0A494X1I5_9BURK|nr:response regulator transcription factor [Trinickia fusca]RKP44588.1 DNA-binding response regulator [Trinickia fusca]